MERQQKQTIERLEQEHTNRLRDEAKRIKGEQDKELSKYQNMLKNRKKEVSMCSASHLISFLLPAPTYRPSEGWDSYIGILIIACFDTSVHTHPSLICLKSVCITTV